MTRSTWTIPILLALGICAGLVSALAGDGIADWPAWVGLGLPVAVIVWTIRVRCD